MQIKNKYIGDAQLGKMLEHYKCPTPLSVVKMKFVGAISSPNFELRPTDVISSFWEEGKSPRLETKEEADLFFKFFMGLWDETFTKVQENKITLSKVSVSNKENLIDACYTRIMEIEFGFNEGFWGGLEDLKIPAFVAELIDSLSELAGVYKTLTVKAENREEIDELVNTFRYTDKMVEKAIAFIIENQVLPNIDNLKRTMQ